MPDVQYPYSSDNTFYQQHVIRLAESFFQLTNENLVSPQDNLEHAIFTAPFAIVSHGTQADPVFNYGNQTALELFEMKWLEFTSLPSRYSAETITQEEREALLTRVSQYGFIDDYRGIRISSSGQRFMIKRAIVWNIIDKDEQYYGQAAALYEWDIL